LNLINKNVKIAIIALQEIWSVQYPDLFNIPGFSFVYKLRSNGRGGGVAFYVQNDIKFSIKNVVPFIDSQFENLVLEAYINKQKYYFCNVYRSPTSPHNESQRDLIENFNGRLEELRSN
jgi:hypothetical protein